MSDYTPDTDAVRGAYVANYFDRPHYESREEFDRWLAEHDEQLRMKFMVDLSEAWRENRVCLCALPDASCPIHDQQSHGNLVVSQP